MSSLSYVDPPNDNLICCICRTPFVDPLKARSCRHTFCRTCILTALSVSSQCPIDRYPLTVDDLSPADPLIRNLCDELVVYCPQRQLGCLHTTQRQLVEAHLRDTCLYVETSCAEKLCDKQVLKKLASHADHCDASPVVHGPEAVEKSQTRHDEPTTEAVPCPQACNGCSWTGPADDLEPHKRACPYEAIKGFFEIYSSRLASLSDENAALRRKVQALEGSTNILRRENEDIKRALGPWYRPHVQEEALLASTTRFPTELLPPSAERPNLRVPLSGSHGGAITDTSESVTASPPIVPPVHSPSRTPNATGQSGSWQPSNETSDIASYFPPEGLGEQRFDERQLPDSDVLFALDGAASSSTDATGGPQARSPPTSYPYHEPGPHVYPSASPYGLPPGPLPPASSSSPPQVPAVAPLNISTSLHRSLLSLRESIVTLSTAVDSLARRQDVALATEALRLNEELRSLRVVIHGLRMQMHSIMMDRNMQAVAASSGARTPVAEPATQPAPSGAFVPGWVAGLVPPLPFAGPRYPPYPFPQAQNQAVSGPKL